MCMAFDTEDMTHNINKTTHNTTHNTTHDTRHDTHKQKTYKHIVTATPLLNQSIMRSEVRDFQRRR